PADSGSMRWDPVWRKLPSDAKTRSRIASVSAPHPQTDPFRLQTYRRMKKHFSVNFFVWVFILLKSWQLKFQGLEIYDDDYVGSLCRRVAQIAHGTRAPLDLGVLGNWAVGVPDIAPRAAGSDPREKMVDWT